MSSFNTLVLSAYATLAVTVDGTALPLWDLHAFAPMFPFPATLPALPEFWHLAQGFSLATVFMDSQTSPNRLWSPILLPALKEMIVPKMFLDCKTNLAVSWFLFLLNPKLFQKREAPSMLLSGFYGCVHNSLSLLCTFRAKTVLYIFVFIVCCSIFHYCKMYTI